MSKVFKKLGIYLTKCLSFGATTKGIFERNEDD
jgi:hypothetical protein